MTRREQGPTREDAAYAAVFDFLRRNGFTIAFVLPLLLVLVWEAGPWALAVWVIWLAEAAGYALLRLLQGAHIRDAPGAIRHLGKGLGLRIIVVCIVIGFVAIDQARALLAAPG